MPEVNSRRCRPLLGTYVDITAVGPCQTGLDHAMAAAFAAVELVHRLMSVHNATSDLARLNRDAWRGPVDVHPWTARTLRWALAIHRATDGLFDCAVGHELAGRGLMAGCVFEGVDSGTMADVELTRDGRVRFARRIGLDFGGIAKGFAVDRAVATLHACGVRSAVVNAGGDLRIMGDEPQPIHLRDPADFAVVRYAGLLSNGAIATSNASPDNGLVSARDRTSIVDGNAYSIVAPTCVVADALTKVLAQTRRTDSPWLSRFGAMAVITPPQAQAA